jgi:hypothetical protein
MPVSPLARRFAKLFSDVAAQAMLAPLRPHSRIPTFCFTTTSLRHLRRVFDRLNDIDNGQIVPHGNFLADPRAIGLVDRNAPNLSLAGQELLSYRATLRDDPARGEYELLKILYFGGYAHAADVQHLLDDKRDHILAVLHQFVPRRIFLDQPSLLVIAEYIGSFPNALSHFLTLGDGDLNHLIQLGENGFASFCSDPSLPQGLSYLCRRIGGEYTRAEERRLHQIVSMALLTIAQTIPPGGTTSLSVPAPYSNLLTEKDIFDIHLNYTSDLSVWPDGVGYQVSTSLTIPVPAGAPIQLQNIQLQPQIGIPSGIGNAASANHQSRKRRRGTQKSQSSVIINPLLSEKAEDYVGDIFLRPQHGDNLVRVGHRSGEVIALPDGMVPGADFYVLDVANDPTEFIEVKCTSGPPPTDISLTRAEYLRVCRCLAAGIPYRLILLDVPNRQCYEVADFAAQIGNLDLSQVNQFTARLA